MANLFLSGEKPSSGTLCSQSLFPFNSLSTRTHVAYLFSTSSRFKGDFFDLPRWYRRLECWTYVSFHLFFSLLSPAFTVFAAFVTKTAIGGCSYLLRRPPATGCGMLASSTRELSTNTSKKLMLASEGLSFQDCFLTKCFNTKNSVHKHQLCRAFPKTTLFFLLTSR